LGASYTDQQFRTGIPDTYTVRARKNLSCDGSSCIRLVSTGRVPTCLQEGGPGGVPSVQADIARQSTPLAAPFVGRDVITLNKEKACTNSYNSFVGNYTATRCPFFNATTSGAACGAEKGNPIKVLGCGGDLWTDGLVQVSTTSTTKCDAAHPVALCLKDGS